MTQSFFKSRDLTRLALILGGALLFAAALSVVGAALIHAQVDYRIHRFLG